MLAIQRTPKKILTTERRAATATIFGTSRMSPAPGRDTVFVPIPVARDTVHARTHDAVHGRRVQTIAISDNEIYGDKQRDGSRVRRRILYAFSSSRVDPFFLFVLF